MPLAPGPRPRPSSGQGWDRAAPARKAPSVRRRRPAGNRPAPVPASRWRSRLPAHRSRHRLLSMSGHRPRPRTGGHLPDGSAAPRTVIAMVMWLMEWLGVLYGAFLGGCLASFGCVVSERVPAGLSIGGRSVCACGRQLKVRENIPWSAGSPAAERPSAAARSCRPATCSGSSPKPSEVPRWSAGRGTNGPSQRLKLVAPSDTCPGLARHAPAREAGRGAQLRQRRLLQRPDDLHHRAECPLQDRQRHRCCIRTSEVAKRYGAAAKPDQAEDYAPASLVVHEWDRWPVF
jgi:hypothetical protein